MNGIFQNRICTLEDDELSLNSSKSLEYCIEYNDTKIRKIAAYNGKYYIALNNINKISELTIDKVNDGNWSEYDEYYVWIDRPILYRAFKKIYDNNQDIVGKYGTTVSENKHNDVYNVVGNKKIYYFTAINEAHNLQESELQSNSILSKNNVIFAGQCWQMLRTIDTGGVKLLYNGEAIGNKCKNITNDTGASRHIGYAGEYKIDSSEIGIGTNTSYWFADDYRYENGKFYLEGNKKTLKWNSASKEDLLGMYTCKSSSSTTGCGILYLISNYQDSSHGKAIILNSNSKYLQLGTLQFDSTSSSVGYAGYMYGVIYETGQFMPETGLPNNIMWGNDVKYENGNYILQNIKNTSEHNPTTHHYFCENGNVTCEEVRFMTYYDNRAGSSHMGRYSYIILKDGIKIDEAVNEMLDTKTNMYDSTMKVGLEAWYKKYLAEYTSQIELGTIYCNRRDIDNANSNGIKPNGDITAFPTIGYVDRGNNKDLSCLDVNDQFSVSNGNAKLNYPIGLATNAEMTLLGNNRLRYDISSNNPENHYYLMSPSHYDNNQALSKYIAFNGNLHYNWSAGLYGVRPAITLRFDVNYTKGDGSLDNPYFIE